jgi:hypothetical protein
MDFTWTTSSAGMTNPMTTTGDTIYSSSGSTPARRAIGSTGQVLTVSGGLPVWATPAGGGGLNGYTLINTGGTTLSGSSTVTISGISNKQSIFIYVLYASVGSATAAQMRLRINGDTGSNYSWAGTKLNASSNEHFPGDNTSYFAISQNSNNANSSTVSSTLLLGTKATSGVMFMQNNANASAASGSNQYGLATNGFYKCSAAVTNITFYNPDSVNFDEGTIFVYGMD